MRQSKYLPCKFTVETVCLAIPFRKTTRGVIASKILIKKQSVIKRRFYELVVLARTRMLQIIRERACCWPGILIMERVCSAALMWDDNGPRGSCRSILRMLANFILCTHHRAKYACKLLMVSAF